MCLSCPVASAWKRMTSRVLDWSFSKLMRVPSQLSGAGLGAFRMLLWMALLDYSWILRTPQTSPMLSRDFLWTETLQSAWANKAVHASFATSTGHVLAIGCKGF